MRASLSTWIKLAAAVASLPVDVIHAFMNPPTGSSTLLTLKNRRFHLQYNYNQIENNDQPYQMPNTPSPPSPPSLPNVTPSPSPPSLPNVTPSPSPPIPFGIRLMGGPELERDGYTGRGIKVAVIDSGIDDSHSGFNGKVETITTAKMVITEDSDKELIQKAEDRNVTFVTDSLKYHGTHVAGTIHMMAPEAEIYNYCVFNEVLSTDANNVQTFKNTADDYITAAIYDAIEKGCDIINMSFVRTIKGDVPSYVRLIEKAVREKGITVVCSAGRGDGKPETNEIYYPAYSDETISIASCGLYTNLDTTKSPVLVSGVRSASNDKIDFASIGEDVVSFKPGGNLMKGSGTSFAASHVTGFIAALLDKEQPRKKNLYLYSDAFPKGPYEMSEGRYKMRNEDLVQTLTTNFLVSDIFSLGSATSKGFLTYLVKNDQFSEFMTGEHSQQKNDQLEDRLVETTTYDNWESTMILNSFENDIAGPDRPKEPNPPGPPKPSDK